MKEDIRVECSCTALFGCLREMNCKDWPENNNRNPDSYSQSISRLLCSTNWTCRSIDSGFIVFTVDFLFLWIFIPLCIAEHYCAELVSGR